MPSTHGNCGERKYHYRDLLIEGRITKVIVVRTARVRYSIRRYTNGVIDRTERARSRAASHRLAKEWAIDTRVFAA